MNILKPLSFVITFTTVIFLAGLYSFNSIGYAGRSETIDTQGSINKQRISADIIEDRCNSMLVELIILKGEGYDRLEVNIRSNRFVNEEDTRNPKNIITLKLEQNLSINSPDILSVIKKVNGIVTEEIDSSIDESSQKSVISSVLNELNDYLNGTLSCAARSFRKSNRGKNVLHDARSIVKSLIEEHSDYINDDITKTLLIPKSKDISKSENTDNNDLPVLKENTLKFGSGPTWLWAGIMVETGIDNPATITFWLEDQNGNEVSETRKTQELIQPGEGVGSENALSEWFEFNGDDPDTQGLSQLNPSTLYVAIFEATNSYGTVSLEQQISTTPEDENDSAPKISSINTKAGSNWFYMGAYFQEPHDQGAPIDVTMELQKSGDAWVTLQQVHTSGAEWVDISSSELPEENPLSVVIPDTIYNYRFTAVDDDGDKTEATGSFTTDSLSEEPPSISSSGVKVSLDAYSAWLGFWAYEENDSDALLTARLYLGDTEDSLELIDQKTREGDGMIEFNLSRLTPETTYYYMVELDDDDGQSLDPSVKGYFETLSPEEEAPTFGDSDPVKSVGPYGAYIGTYIKEPGDPDAVLAMELNVTGPEDYLYSEVLTDVTEGYYGFNYVHGSPNNTYEWLINLTDDDGQTTQKSGSYTTPWPTELKSSDPKVKTGSGWAYVGIWFNKPDTEAWLYVEDPYNLGNESEIYLGINSKEQLFIGGTISTSSVNFQLPIENNVVINYRIAGINEDETLEAKGSFTWIPTELKMSSMKLIEGERYVYIGAWFSKENTQGTLYISNPDNVDSEAAIDLGVTTADDSWLGTTIKQTTELGFDLIDGQMYSYRVVGDFNDGEEVVEDTGSFTWNTRE